MTVNCPHAVCRVGLWYVVRSGCPGEIRQDPVNGDRKIWFQDCESCELRGTRSLRGRSSGAVAAASEHEGSSLSGME